MGLIPGFAGPLPGSVQIAAYFFALLQELFTFIRIMRHAIQGFLQASAGSGNIFLLLFHLLGQFIDLAGHAFPALVDLFNLDSCCRAFGIQVGGLFI